MSIEKKQFTRGIVIRPDSVALGTNEGEIKIDSADKKIKARLDSSDKELVTNDQTQTLINKSIDADSNTISNIDNADIKSSAAIELSKLEALTANKALQSDGSGEITASAVTNTELGYVSGVTSGIQGQLDGKMPDTLADGKLFIGNVSNVATPQTISGDITISNDGNAQIASGVILNEDINASAGIDATKLADGSVTNAELQHINSLTSNAQTQLDAKLDDFSSANDNRLVRTDGTSGNAVQESIVSLSDAGVLSGVTQLDVDNVRVDGNTVSSTDTNGDLNISPDGSGIVNISKDLKVTETFRLDSYNDSTTGANATLSSPSTSFARLTGALTSVDMIPAGINGQELVMTNSSGSTVTLNNDTGATAANRIFTGTGSNLDLANNASVRLIYDNTTSRWKVVGGSGSGSSVSSIINLIPSEDTNAEAGVGNYVTYADAAAVSPVDGTGGSPVSTFGVTTTVGEVLRGTKSYKFSKDAANRQGEGFSVPFTAEEADQTLIQEISFEYKTSSSYVDGDLRLYVYDITNSQLIEPVPTQLMATANGRFKALFQATATGASYRVIGHISSTSALAYDVIFDTVRIGPPNKVFGSVTTDWKSFTPTGSWTTNTTYLGFWRRVGDTLEVQTRISLSGAPNATSLSIDLPSGLSIDTAKLASTSGGDTDTFGNLYYFDSGVSSYKGDIAYNNATSLSLRYLDDAATGIAVAGAISSSAPFTWASGDFLSAKYSVPIAGWSSSTQMSDSGDGRPIYAGINITDTALTTSFVAIPGTIATNVMLDNSSSFSVNKFTAPAYGNYLITGEAYVYNFAGASYVNLSLYKNGVLVDAGLLAPRMLTATKTSSFATQITLNKGDYVQLFAATNAGTANIGGGTSAWQISLLNSGNTQIAANELVSLRATTDAGQTSASGVETTLIYEDVAAGADSHNAYNVSTGIYTVPVAGKYLINAKMSWLNTTNMTREFMEIWKNGVEVSRGSENATSFSHHMTISDVIEAVKDDTFLIKIFQIDSGGSARSVQTYSANNTLTITRQGF